MAPVPLALCGKSPEHIQGLSKLLLAEGYDIIHVCSTLPSALTELPALLSPTSPDPPPSSGYGSNANTTGTPTPGTSVAAILIGGGYSPDDVAQIKAAVDAVKPVPFFRADVTKPRPEGSKPGPPPVEELGKRVLEAFGEGGGVQGWKGGEVYLF